MSTKPYRITGVALVTGAASGIGKAVAHTFLIEGCTRMILADLDGVGLQRVADELYALDKTVELCLVKCDVSQEDEVQMMIDKGVAKLSCIDYAVNNAGVTTKPRAPTHELEVEAFDRVQNINLRGVWLCERAQIRQMLSQAPRPPARAGRPPQRGSIVNVSSIFARVAHSTASPYCAVKAGICGLTRSDASAYGKDGIRINSVLPGWIRTPLVDYGIQQGTYDERIVDRVPLRRWGSAQELAEAICFLASDKASYITGAELVVDGGSSSQTVV